MMRVATRTTSAPGRNERDALDANTHFATDAICVPVSARRALSWQGRRRTDRQGSRTRPVWDVLETVCRRILAGGVVRGMMVVAVHEHAGLTGATTAKVEAAHTSIKRINRTGRGFRNPHN